MFTEAGIPVGKEPAVEMTVLSPTEVLFPILMAFTSPLKMAPYQIWVSEPTKTSPMMEALGAIYVL